MTKAALERLSYLAAHKVLALPALDSIAIPGMQLATPGARRTLTVDRIAREIQEVFDGAEAAELEQMMQGATTPIKIKERNGK